MSRQHLDDALGIIRTAIKSDLDVETTDYIMDRLSELTPMIRDKREKVDRAIMNSFSDPLIGKAYKRLTHVMGLRTFKKDGITQSVMKNQIKELRDMTPLQFQGFLDELSRRKWRFRSVCPNTGSKVKRWFQPHSDRFRIDEFDY